MIEGLGIVLITGIVGAGGGFMIVPALHLLGKLSLRHAIATSLFVIGLKSISGIVGDLIVDVGLDLWFLTGLLLMTILGLAIGTQLNGRIRVGILRKSFAWFVLIIGIAMLVTT